MHICLRQRYTALALVQLLHARIHVTGGVLMRMYVFGSANVTAVFALARLQRFAACRQRMR